MSRLGRRAAIAVAAAVACSFALAQIDDPLEILRRCVSARGAVAFAGVRTVVIFEGGQKVRGVEQQMHCQAPHRMRIVVVAPERETGRMCLMDGRVHWEYDPGAGRAVLAQMPPPERVLQRRLEELDRIGRTMRLQYCGIETIAGRPAHVVKVYTPQGLPVKKSWVDTEHWIALKTQQFDSHGQVRSSAYFTRITFSPTFTPGTFEFEPPPDCAVIEASRAPERMSLAEAEQRAGFRAARPRYLPAGYSFQDDRVAVISISGGPALWLPFSNGADIFSLFQRAGAGPTDTLRHGRSITWQDGGYRFTLLGSLSTAEMQRVKTSIRP